MHRIREKWRRLPRPAASEKAPEPSGQATRLALPAVVSAASLLGFLRYDLFVSWVRGTALDVPALDAGRLVLGSVGCLALAVLTSRLVEQVVTWKMARHGRQSPRLVHDVFAAIMFVVAIGAILAFVFDRSLTGALAASGVLVAVLGFALRNTIADIVSGLALSVESPFQIGDWIETEAGVAGKVIEMTWRATSVETRDQVHVVVPNSRIAGGRLTNYSAPRRHYRVRDIITLDFRVPVTRAKAVLLAGVQAAPGIRKSPAPDVRVRAFGTHGIEYLVRYWVPGHAVEIDCRDAVLASIDRHLRFAGIEPLRARACADPVRDEPGLSAFAPAPGLARQGAQNGL